MWAILLWTFIVAFLLSYSSSIRKLSRFIQYWHSRNISKGPTSFVHELHVYKKQHIVRLGNNEFSITDPALLNTIYHDRDFLKSDQYACFDFNGEASLFSMRDPREHQRRVKAVRGMFRGSEVSDKSDIIERGIDRLCECLDSVAQTSAAINVLDLMRGMAIETISLFTLERRYMEDQDRTLLEVGRSIGLVLEDINHTASFGYSDAWLVQQCRKIRDKINAMIHPKEVLDMELSAAYDYYTSYSERIAQEAPTSTYAGHLAALDLSGKALETEVADLLFSGTDSTATTLATALWYIYSDEDVLSRLRDDLEYVDDSQLATRPYLTAVIDETLRLRPPVPRRLPRVVPHNKDIFYAEDKHNDEWHKILPAGSTVGISAYSLHRDPVFEDAEKFLPERWLTSDQAKKDRMRTCFIPFSKGARACIGQELARSEIRLVLRRIVERYDGKTVSDEPEHIDHFNASIVGGKVLLSFSRRE